MKKSAIVIFAALLVCCLACCFVCCGYSNKADSEASADSVTSDTSDASDMSDTTEVSDTCESEDETETVFEPTYALKEIESIVFNSYGHGIAEAVEGFYQDADYNYCFSSMISKYVVVTYKDGTVENVRDALSNLHIKITDLNRFGIGYYMVENSIDKIVDFNDGLMDQIEYFYSDEKYDYLFMSKTGERIIVYYEDGTFENVIEALDAGRVTVPLLNWFGIDYVKTSRKPTLTMPQLNALVAKYGKNLTWKHLENYYYQEGGSGLYIRSYHINAQYVLLIGGGNANVSPDYIYLSSLNRPNTYVDVRTVEDFDAFLNSDPGILEAPDDFSFSLTWGCYGISSYDSQTGKLVKTTDAANPDDFVTYYQLEKWEKQYIYSLLSNLCVGRYPDDYYPENGYSKPSATLVLTVRMGDFEKTVRAEDISLIFESDNEMGQNFLDACVYIQDILTSTDEWLALPDYENFYE